MIHKKIKLLSSSKATLTTYILDDGEFGRTGYTHPAIIVCPGGGYSYCSKNEGEPVALFFARHGYHAFVLDYSTKIENPFPTALKELAKAMSIVRAHQEEWRINGDISVIGFSAGGNLAMSLGCFYKKPYLTSEMGLLEEEIKPNRIILGYPAITLHPKREGPLPQELVELIEKGLMPDFRGPSIREILLGKENASKDELENLSLLHHLHKDIPPVFAFGSFLDTVIPPTDILDLGSELSKLEVPCEIHLFGQGNHGVSLCDETIKDESEVGGLNMRNWPDLCLNWMKHIK